MKPGKLVLIIVIAACLAITAWQFNNFKIIFREYHASHKFYHYGKYDWMHKSPLINERIAQTDPEAAAVINYNCQWLPVDDIQRMNALAKNITKFPDNQFFLYELGLRSCFVIEEGLDPTIMLKTADRLIALDNSNANYYYMKAYALLHLRNQNILDEVIETVNKAASCGFSKDPSLLYKDRVIAIARKQELPKSITQTLEITSSHNFFVNRIYTTLLLYENLLITEKDYANADLISKTLNAIIPDNMSRSSFMSSNLHHFPFKVYGLGYGAGRWGLPQEIELQRKDLTPQQADQKRLELCSIVRPLKKVEYINKLYAPDEETRFFLITLSPFLAFARFAAVFILILVVLKISCFFHKKEMNIETNKAALIRFLIFITLFFMTSQFLSIKLLDQGFYSYQNFFLPQKITLERLKEMIDAPKRFLVIPLIPFAIVLCFKITSLFKQSFDNIFTRFISAVLFAVPLGLSAITLQGHTFLKYVPFIIFLPLAFKYSFRKISFFKIFKAFAGSRNDEVSALRLNLFRFSLTGFILSWFALALLAYPARKSMDEKPTLKRVYSYSFTNDYEKTYKHILAKFDDSALPMGNILRLIPLVKSSDLPAVMEKLKNKKFRPYRSFFNFPVPEQKKYDELDERSITFLLMTAGRDQMPIILRYLNNPDNEMALVFRAQLGDKSVKNKLENILRRMKADPNHAQVEQMSDYNILKPRESQIVFALASISEPDEAFNQIKVFVEERTQIDHYVCLDLESVCTLPKDVILKIYNFQLDNFETQTPDPNNFFDYVPFPHFAGENQRLYLDNKTAARILRLILSKKRIDRQISRLGIENYLTANNSDLLLKGLQSSKDELRAWSLAQLLKIKYQFTPDQLQILARDKSWKVRANLALIDKSIIPDSEPSPFVKLLKSF